MNDGTSRRPCASRTWMFPGLAVLVAVVVALLAAEVGLRIFHHVRGTYRFHHEEADEARRSSIWTRSDDPLLIYVHRPDYRKDGVRQTEAHGILSPDDVSVDKPAGTLRILLLGDSIGAGLTLPFGERMSTLLEARLEASLGRTVEVLNFSVNGYKTVQEARLLETSAGRFDPDLILLAYCMNDVANSLTPTVWFCEPPAPRVYLWEEVTERLGAAAENRELYVPTFGPHYGDSRYWHELYNVRSLGWQSVAEGFDRISWYGQEHGVRVLVVIFPFLLPEGWYRGGVEPLHRQVAAAARNRGFEMLDLLPVFARYDAEDLRAEPEDLFHPNAEGHRIAAEAIHPRIVEMLKRRRR